MTEHTDLPAPPERLGDVESHLASLKLSFIAAPYAALAKDAAHKAWSHVDYLAKLLEGEADLRRDRATQSRIRLARFPVIKTVEQFRWDWPKIFNHDSTLTAAILDRLLHHADTVLIEGRSFRMKDQLEQ